MKDFNVHVLMPLIQIFMSIFNKTDTPQNVHLGSNFESWKIEDQ